MIQIIVFILMNSIVALSSFLLTCKIFKITDPIDSLICFFLCGFAQIVATELLLGVFGLLFMPYLVGVNLMILFIFWLVTKKEKIYFGPAELKGLRERSGNNKILLFAFSVLLGFTLVKLLVNLLNPPFGWDSLNYHFTFPVEWLKSGSLSSPITIFDDPSPTYYPINGSLFYLWLILPLRSVFLADLGQFPFFLVAGLVVFSIARKIGLNNVNSLYGALLFMLIPNFFKQMQIAYVDIMVAALFLACVNWLFLLEKSFDLKNVFVFSLSLGLLIGTKTVALPYSILLLLPFSVMACKNYKKAHLLVVFLLSVFIWGGFSYCRNFLETGNPLYPLDFKIFGIALFKGAMDKASYSVRFSASDYSLAKALFHEGLGAQFLLIAFPAIFLALPVALARKKKELNFNFVYFMVLPTLIYLVFRFVIPLGNLRYLYCLMGIGMVLGFYLLQVLKVKKPVINFLLMLCVLVSIPELAKRQELIVSLAVSTLFFIILFNFKKIGELIPVRSRGVLIVFSLCAFTFFVRAKDFYDRNEYPRYLSMVKYSGFWPDAAKAWDWLNANTQGQNIAYAGRPVPFPLYGTNFKNNVFYVSVNRSEPAKLHYFPNARCAWEADFMSMHKNFESPDNYRGRADYGVWLGNLKKRRTNYFFVYSLHHLKQVIFPMEDDWARAHPDKFLPAFENETIRIYKVRS